MWSRYKALLDSHIDFKKALDSQLVHTQNCFVTESAYVMSLSTVWVDYECTVCNDNGAIRK